MMVYWTIWTLVLLVTLTAGLKSEKKVVCYYAKSSEERNYAYRLFPQNIDATLCTHIVYSCSIPDLTDGVLPTDFLRSLTTQGGAEEFANLRKQNPDLTLILSIGGWKEGSARFSKIALGSNDREWFARHAVDVVRYIGFDGLDINWQWPGLRRGGTEDDRANLVKLIQALKRNINKDAEEKKKTSLQLSLVLPPFKEMVEKGFDLENIKSEVDYFILLTMDYYLSTDPKANHHAPLHKVSYPGCQEDFNVEATVENYLKLGVRPDMMVLGIPLYGQSFMLENAYESDVGAEAEDEGTRGFGTKTTGILAYFEICKYVKDYGWTVRTPNASAMGPYAYFSKNWVAYDDPAIIKKKVEFAMQKCLGGIMIWSLDMDDFKGWCYERFPLTKAAKEALAADRSTCRAQPDVSTKSPVQQDQNRKPFKFIKREKWRAVSATEEIPHLRVFPAPFVIIGHTVSLPCSNFQECMSAVQNIQTHHISIGLGDIGYSFLVGGDGNVYEGLGWNRHGAHSLPFNARSLAIAFIGSFGLVSPPQKQVDAALRLIAEAVRLGQITPNYKVFGQRQVIAVDSPGNELMKIIKSWPHWAEYDPIEDDDD